MDSINQQLNICPKRYLSLCPCLVSLNEQLKERLDDKPNELWGSAWSEKLIGRDTKSHSPLQTSLILMDQYATLFRLW